LIILPLDGKAKMPLFKWAIRLRAVKNNVGELLVYDDGSLMGMARNPRHLRAANLSEALPL
jgi:hypothetical protein